MSDEILTDYDALSQKEQRAWQAWFAGALQHVTQYEDEPASVFMGKAECQWVPFDEFWLGKVIDLGWMTAEIQRTGIAKGKTGQPKFTEFRFWPTELGFDIHDAELARWRRQVDEQQKKHEEAES